MKYPPNWLAVKDSDGCVIYHQRLCNRYRVQRSAGGDYICWHSPTGDGFGEFEIGKRDGISAAMAFCRLHLDGHLSATISADGPKGE